MTFSASLRQFAEATNRTMTDTLVETVQELTVRVVQRSPVDTGKFRGNWQIGDGGPDVRVDSGLISNRWAAPQAPPALRAGKIN